MFNQYFPLLVIILLAAVVGFVAISLGVIFGPHRPTARKSEPYESGMVPYGPGNRRISVRYYLVAVLFILFDIEVVFVLPYAVVFRQLAMPGFLLMAFFIIILEVAYVYAWKKGALEWE